MNILVISTYPPMTCGIGKYAREQVEALRAEGHRVDVMSPPEGEGDYQVDLLGGWRPLLLFEYLWAYDDVFIHFTPQFFYLPENRLSRLWTSLSFLILTVAFGRRISFLIHETGYRLGVENKGRLRHLIDRWYWLLARRVIFHSVRERDAFAEHYSFEMQSRHHEIWPQDKYVVRHCPLDKAEARRALALDADSILLLCIGFIQPHKGFERPINALREIDAPNLHLRIVGSVRLIWDKAHQYAQSLHDLADQDPRVEVLEAYLSDEMFDTWVVAADYVVVPYHEIWTSAVAARAKLYQRSLIAANTGGLSEQLTEGSKLFNNDEELVTVLREIVAESNHRDHHREASRDKKSIPEPTDNDEKSGQVTQLSMPLD